MQYASIPIQATSFTSALPVVVFGKAPRMEAGNQFLIFFLSRALQIFPLIPPTPIPFMLLPAMDMVMNFIGKVTMISGVAFIQQEFLNLLMAEEHGHRQV